MLKELHVENYLLINHLDIDFSNKLNIITGETGAGKSILLGAISLIMGAKGDSNVAKDKSKKAILEATFLADGLADSLRPLFQQEDIDLENEIIIRRVISTSGKSKFFVNQEPVTIGFLRSLGERLIDIHSQHQTLFIGNIDFQIGVLDSVADNYKNIEQYNGLYAQVKQLQSELEGAKAEAERSTQEQEYLQFQYNQLSEAQLIADEAQQLEADYLLLSNSQMISENLYHAIQKISQEDESILNRLSDVKMSVSKVAKYLKNSEDYTERLDSVTIELKELDREFESLLDNISNDPTELERISNRLDLLNSLMMKYKVTSVDELIELREQYSAKLELISNFEFHISEAKKRLAESYENAVVVASTLSNNRIKAKSKLEKFVIEMLAELGMPNSILEVSIQKSEKLTKFGIDNVEFLFSANKGVACQQIAKVASGGEMSRLMLSLKALISSKKSMPTIIFDEIDTGVSGKVADKMGEIIMNMSGSRQIINITHLPQVAAKGDTHLYVYKEHNDNESVTKIKTLSKEERVSEIASMLSGEKTTESAIAQARELLRHG